MSLSFYEECALRIRPSLCIMGTKQEIDTLRDKIKSLQHNDSFISDGLDCKQIITNMLSLSENNKYHSYDNYSVIYWGTMAEGVHCYMLIFRLFDKNYIDTVVVNPAYDPAHIRCFQKKISDCIDTCTRLIRRYSSHVSIITQTDFTLFRFNSSNTERILIRVFNLYHKGKIYEKKVECNLNKCHKYYTINLSDQEKTEFNAIKESYFSARKKEIINIVMYYYSIIDNHYKAMFQIADYIFEASFNTGCPLGRKMFDFRVYLDGITYSIA